VLAGPNYSPLGCIVLAIRGKGVAARLAANRLMDLGHERAGFVGLSLVEVLLVGVHVDVDTLLYLGAPFLTLIAILRCTRLYVCKCAYCCNLAAAADRCYNSGTL
jgi:hypothetical protein